MLHSVFLLCLAAVANGAAVRPSTTLPDIKIIGGNTTSIEEFPHQIALMINGKFDCGGSIIRKNVVLTAAHCTYGEPVSIFSIRAGSSYYATGGVVAAVDKKYEHKYFSDSVLGEYDYSILFLSKSLEFGSTINAIALPEQGQEIKPKTQAVAIGWGRTSDNTDSEVLLKVSIPVLSQEECDNVYKNHITDRMICAGTTKGKGTCSGDSGGPLIVNEKLIGITSWGTMFCNNISVFAKVSYVINWINDTISSNM